MMLRKASFSLILILSIASACAPEPEPTMSAAEVQGTAVAAAWTMVAETQAAIPTDTPVPPTETASPTPIQVFPTLTFAPQVLATNTLSSQANSPGDICSDLKHVIPEGAAGPKATIKIVNEFNGPATISIYLNKTDFGECGYRYYQLAKNGGSVVVLLPQGCYTAWAWGSDPKKTFNASGDGLCCNNSDKWTMVIRGERVIMLPP
jgi:hypothetical protein